MTADIATEDSFGLDKDVRDTIEAGVPYPETMPTPLDAAYNIELKDTLSECDANIATLTDGIEKLKARRMEWIRKASKVRAAIEFMYDEETIDG